MTERATHDLAIVLLEQQRAAMVTELTAVADAFKDPIDGSPRAADAAWIEAQPSSRREALNGILSVAAGNVAELLRVADEHARGLQVLLGANEILPIPATTLVRSIHDAFLSACWSADPRLSPEQRIVRGAAITLAVSQEKLRTLKQLPNPPAQKVADARAGMEGMQAYLVEHGFVLNFGKNASPYATSATYGTSLATLKINVTDASEKYMPGSHYMWSLGSGATHSRNWFTAGLAGPRSQLSIMVTAPVLDFCDALIDNLTAYVGLDAHEFHRRAHTRRRALMLRNEGSKRSDVSAGYDDYAKQRDRTTAATT